MNIRPAAAVLSGVSTPPGLDRLLGTAWREVFEHLDDAILVLDEERNIQLMNRRARELLGYDGVDDIGGRCRATTRGHDCNEACPLTYTLKTGRRDAVTDFAAVYRRSDGRAVRLDVTIVPLCDADETFRGAIEILRPAAPDCGFYLAGASETAVALRRRLLELASSPHHLVLRGERPARDDVARAFHAFGGLDDRLLFVWEGSWDTIPGWPPGTLLADHEAVEHLLSEGLPDGWRLVVTVPLEAEPSIPCDDGFELLTLPTPRERREDLPQVVAAWIERLSPGLRASPAAIGRLCRIACDRGLEGLQPVLSEAVAAAGGRIEEDDVPADGYCTVLVDEVLGSDNPFAALEEHLLKEVLDRCGWRMQEAADRLGISRVTLWRKLRDHDLSRPEDLDG